MINHSDQLIQSHVLGYFKIISLNLELSFHQFNRCDNYALKISFKLLLSPLSEKSILYSLYNIDKNKWKVVQKWTERV